MAFGATLQRFFHPDEPAAVPIWRSRVAVRMFWVALILRLAFITIAHTYRFRVLDDHFQFAWEEGRIARALNTGFGYADPFAGHTGPTAWTPPLYPLLLAAIFRVCGIYTNLSAWVLLAFNSLFSAAVAPAIYELATRCYGPRRDGQGVALWSGWLWVLYPAALQYAVHWPWEMCLTCCLFTWVLVVGLRLRDIGGYSPHKIRLWAAFGILWGLIALTNSSLLSFLPFQGLWIAWHSRRQLVPMLSRVALATLLFAACVAPWIVRNALVFHAFIPLRGNFGAELYQAALPSNDGFPWGTTLPLNPNAPELRHYAAVGEVAFSREQQARALAIIRADPQRFLKQVLQRIDFFWISVPHPIEHGLANEVFRELNFSFLSFGGFFGLALSLRRRVPAAGIFGTAFLVIPLVYYLVTTQARFRHPLEPLIDVFIVYLFRNADRTRAFSLGRNRQQPTGVPA